MKILILEDDQIRMDSFYEKFPKDEITWVQHADEAIKNLINSEFDLILLDHDLGGQQMNYDAEDCGTVVAEYINNNPLPEHTMVIIHSFNVPAANRMQKLIPYSQHIPGFWVTNPT